MSFRVVLLCLFCWVAQPGLATNLQKFTDVRLLDNPGNDGDSFLVQAGDRQLHLRLYFVDCPESVATTDADAKRVREQAQYFGITDAKKVFQYGRAAQEFTGKALTEPFTIHTSFASAMGRSPGGRIYAFVITHDGRDLAKELVAAGLARAYGTKRAGPDDRPSDVLAKELAAAELDAMHRRVGMWDASDPDVIEKLRADAQREKSELRELIAESSAKNPPPLASVDINTATTRELQAISGIGPTLAAKIIEGRPYKTVEDLLRVHGMGARLLERVRPYLICTPPPS
jgi:competence ComEA-like helix-hairpin-helix protein